MNREKTGDLDAEIEKARLKQLAIRANDAIGTFQTAVQSYWGFMETFAAIRYDYETYKTCENLYNFYNEPWNSCNIYSHNSNPQMQATASSVINAYKTRYNNAQSEMLTKTEAWNEAYSTAMDIANSIADECEATSDVSNSLNCGLKLPGKFLSTTLPNYFAHAQAVRDAYAAAAAAFTAANTAGGQ